MRLSAVVAWLVAAGVVVAVLGSALTLASATLGLGGVAPPFVAAATATVVLLIVSTLAAVLVGLRGGDGASTPYW
jgi:hypothetical protein